MPLVIDNARYISIRDGGGSYIRFPSLTTTEINALNASNGMVVYNETTSALNSYEGGAWGTVDGGAGSDTTAIHDNVSAEISAITEKTGPVAGDWLLGEDSEDSNAKVRIAIGSLNVGHITGVEWDQTSDTWTRIDNDGETITLTRAAFDNFWPWAGMRRVNLSVTGEINAVVGDNNYTEDGSNGRVMVQIPKFWARSEAYGNRVTVIVVGYAAGGGNTITITPAGESPTVWTEGVDFTAETSDGVTATNIAAAIDGTADYSATAVGAHVIVSYDSGKAIDSCASDDTAAWSTGITHTKHRRWISDHAAAGFEIHPAFRQRVGGTVAVPTGTIAQYIYTSAYEATLVLDDAGAVQLGSKAGEQPFTGASIAKVIFASGANEPAIGDTISCADAAETAVVVACHLATGAWDGSGAGDIYLKHSGDATLGWLTAKLLTNDTQASEALATSNGGSAELALDIDDARGYGEAVGTGWGITLIHSLAARKLLNMIEYGNLDSQTNIGRGVVDLAGGTGFAGLETSAASIDSNLAANGTGVGTGDNGDVPVTWRWIENPWGNTWEFTDGYEAVDAAYHVLKVTGAWDNSGPSVWDSDDYDVSEAVPIMANGYISNIVYEAVLKHLLIPAAVAGSSSICIPDYFYAHDAGETNILLAGGRWDCSSCAGLGYLRSAGVASGSARSIGARLEFIG